MSFRELLSKPGVKPVLFTMFMASFGFGVILPILPFYALSLGAKPSELGVLTAVFAFMSMLLAPIFGKMADRFGRKKVLMVSTFGFAVSYVLFALAGSLEVVFLARALEGLFAAGIFPSCVSLLSDLSSVPQRGKAMALSSMAFSSGLIIGPAFGGIASSFAVSDAFFLASALSLVNFASIWLQLKEPKAAEETSDLAEKEISLLERLSSPMLFIFLAAFMTTFMIGGLNAVFAIFAAEKFGFTSSDLGLFFTYIGVLILAMQFVSGSLVNRFGEHRLIQAGLVFSGIGFMLLALAHDWLTLLLPLTVFTWGNALVFPSVSSLISKSVTGNKGVVFGLDASFRSLGQVIGPLLGGFLYEVNHAYAFIGMALVIWFYFVVFTLLCCRRKK